MSVFPIEARRFLEALEARRLGVKCVVLRSRMSVKEHSSWSKLRKSLNAYILILLITIKPCFSIRLQHRTVEGAIIEFLSDRNL